MSDSEQPTAATKRRVQLGSPPPPEGWPVYLGEYETMTRAVREYAAMILEQHGWMQEEWGNLEDHVGPFCMFGALIVSRRTLGASANAEDLVVDQLVRELRLHVFPGAKSDLPSDQERRREAVLGWNDEGGRKVHDVLAALRGTYEEPDDEH